MTPEEKKLLEPFLDAEGRLMKFPSKQKKKLAALFYLAEKFPAGEEWTEKQVNEQLNTWHTFGDPATLRRELYDHCLLERAKDGSVYWKSEEK